MGNFTNSEEKGRQCFNNLFGNYNITYSEDKYSWWDASGTTSSGQEYISEIKVRYKAADEYPTALAEVSKITKLKNHSDQTGIPTFYVNFHPDQTLIWNVQNLDLSQLRIEKSWLPATTDGDNRKRIKESFYLDKSQAKRINKGFIKLNNK